ncbi:thioredoxin domain-containing protein [Calidifontibacter terrae]
MANQLAGATSPYLLQHADNPVDWWEWSAGAFAEAKRRDVPILLSIGYAACHWCHVMAHESFENPATAALMNERFVNIKVDREERPDLDSVYMSATTAMAGHGGWPMTCVLDHEGLPFFAGTYFPPQPRHGQPSFEQVLTFLSGAWVDRRDDVRASTEALREFLNRAAAHALPIPADALDTAETLLQADFDQQFSGFGGAPKFPPSMVLEFLRLRKTPLADQMRSQTLDAMARGGIYDQVGGGFARYSVDREWVVPHFEKMLYDNAQLLNTFARQGDPLSDRITRETADFMLAELLTGQGGFASSLDADSDGVEGTFYVWTPTDLQETLGEEAGWAATTFNVTAAGTFEEGASTLQLLEDPDDTDRFDRVRTKLQVARDRRTRPARDDKVVAGWNGLAIDGLLAAGLTLAEPRFVAAAERAADHLLETHLVDGRLRRVSRDGRVGRPLGVLEDHGELAGALARLAGATGQTRHLDAAIGLLDNAIALFGADDGGFYDTGSDADALVSRPRDGSDNASPSGLSAMVNALLDVAALTADDSYAERADAALRTATELITRAPRFAGSALVAALRIAEGNPCAVVVGEPGAARDRFVAEVSRAAAGPVVVTDGGSTLPIAIGKNTTDGHPTAYVCRGSVCEPPRTRLDG